MVSHRGLTDKKLFGDRCRRRAGPHQGDDLQFSPSQLTNGRDILLTHRKLGLSQLLANKHLKLVRCRHITEKMDDGRRLFIFTGEGNTADVDPQRFARPRPSRHLKMLNQVSATQGHLEWTGPLTKLITVTVAAIEEFAALLSDDLLRRRLQDLFGGRIAKQNFPGRRTDKYAIGSLREKSKSGFPWLQRLYIRRLTPRTLFINHRSMLVFRAPTPSLCLAAGPVVRLPVRPMDSSRMFRSIA